MSRSIEHTLFACLASLFFIVAVADSTSSTSPSDGLNDQTYIDDTYGQGISIYGGIIGGLLILLGLFLMLLGSRVLFVTISIAGFIAFGTFAWIVLTNAEPSSTYGAKSNEIYFGVCVGVGLVGGGLGFFLATYMVYLAGAVGGFVLFIYILSWSSTHLIQDIYARIGLHVAITIFFAIIAFPIVFILTTPIIGAFSFIVGLDLFVHVGLINAVRSLLDGNKFHNIQYIINWRIYLMLCAVIVLCLVGIIIQSMLKPKRAPDENSSILLIQQNLQIAPHFKK